MHLNEVANDLSNRLIRIWLPDEKGDRPFERASGNSVGEAVGFPGTLTASPTERARDRPASDPLRRDAHRYWFHEYFHGDTGTGLGASHQTGWPGLVAKLIQQQGEFGTIAKSNF